MMNQQEFLRRISELTETELANLSPSTELTELAIWDSMAAAAFVAMAAELGGQNLDLVAGIQKAKTVGDLFALVQGAGDPRDAIRPRYPDKQTASRTRDAA